MSNIESVTTGLYEAIEKAVSETIAVLEMGTNNTSATVAAQYASIARTLAETLKLAREGASS
jgi:hypothetical protein